MSDTLKAGDELAANSSLVSSSGQFTLVMQGDGNLVLYQNGVATGHSYWSTETEWLAPAQRPVTLTLQSDALLVLKDANGTSQWNSGTWGTFTDPRLLLQDDGNLVVYDANQQPIWATGRPDGVGRIGARGQVSGGLDFTVQTCGRLPPVIAGSTDLGGQQPASVDVSGVAYQIVEQRRRIVNDITQQAYLQDLEHLGVWPGQVVQGATLLSGDLAEIGPLTRAPGTVTITTDLISANPGTHSSRVQAPTLETVTTARQDMLHRLSPTSSPGMLSDSYDSAATYQEFGVKAGVTVSSKTFGVDANMTLNQTFKQSTVVAVIRQVFYNVVFSPDSGGAFGIWDKTVTPGDLKAYCRPGNPPLYVDSVQYGRFICASATASNSSQDLTAALKAHFEYSVKGTVDATVDWKQILSNSSIRIYTYGVPGSQEFKDGASIDDLAAVYGAGLNFSLANPGAPVSFTCRHVLDNTLAHVALVAEYTQALSATGIDVNDAQFFVIDGPGGGEVFTGIRLNPGDRLTTHADGSFWNGVIFSGPTTPDGWPGHKADPAAELPAGTAYCLVAKIGNGDWFEMKSAWDATVDSKSQGVLILAENDNIKTNGDGKHWTVHVDVHRKDAASAGVYVS